jgi:DinB family protein
MSNDTPLRQHLLSLLNDSNAHVDFETAVKDLPAAKRGIRPPGLDHSPWELLEHLRIAQWDILDFSRNPNYETRKWPDDYWPETPAPPNDAAWDHSIRSFRRDLKALSELVADESTDLFAKIPHGDGQTLLREVMLTADHNAYHVGQLVLVRKLLEIWP